MARYNEILVGRFNSFLRKHLGMRGESPAPQIASEISPSLQLHSGKENIALEGWSRFAISLLINAGGAGNFGQFRLRNPTAGGVIAVVEFVAVSANVADLLAVTVGTGVTLDLANNRAANVAPLDSRHAAQATCIPSDKNNSATQTLTPAVLQAQFAAATLVNVLVDDNHELALLPGMALGICDTTANVSLNFNVWWRERILEESERT